MSPRTTIAAEFDVTAGSDSATVRKLLTPRGQLLEIESGSVEGSPRQIRVDALGLESLSWQTAADLADQLGCDLPPGRDTSDDARSAVESVEVSNEYADVVVSKATTPTGDALVVRAPVKRTELRLHPAMLAELTAYDTDLFSEFLETPHGPHDH
ncbi:hypothetical protein [Halobellus sp. GM3]|uniref:hypothetical protein n=1 Tax=Halobellus sp. GM3 TaxID=3458410 RepID=UPI00403DACFB